VYPAALIAAVALLAAFVRIEQHAADPLLDLAALKRHGAIPPNLVALALTATTTPPMFLCTLYAQHELHLAPATAGLLFPPFNVAVIAGSLLGPRVAHATSKRAAMAGGLAAIAAGALVLTAGTVPALLTGFAVMGAGLGVASVASTTAGTEALDQSRQGVAGGLLNTSAQVGTTLGLAVTTPLSGYRPGFILAGAVAALAAGLLAFRLPGEQLVPRARLRRRY
jgi:predicted MFS family arabinose efflux permease